MEVDPQTEVPLRSGNERDLLNDPVGKTLFLFALPALGVNILQTLNGSISAAWVGQLLGEAALAATANAGMIMFLALSGVIGFSMAATILIGQFAGRGDMVGARRIFGGAVGMFLLFGIATAILGWIFTPQLLNMLAMPAEAYGLALAYLPFVFLGMPIYFIMILLSASLRGVGDAVTPLRSSIANVLLALVLNPVLILGLGPFPEMGVAGAGLAMLLAGLISTIYLMQQIYAQDISIRLRGSELAFMKPTMRVAAPVLGMGLPIGLSVIVMSLSGLVMIGLINREGVDTAAAYGVLMQIWSYVMMPTAAVSGAVSAMAAQNIGANKWNRVSSIAWSGMGINTAMSAVLVAISIIFAKPLLWLFLDPESAAIPIAIHINHLVGWTYIVMGISMITSSVVRANGAVYPPLLLLFISMILVRVGFGLWLHPDYGANAIWFAFGMSAIASLIMGIGYYLYGNWRDKKPMEMAAFS